MTESPECYSYGRNGNSCSKWVRIGCFLRTLFSPFIAAVAMSFSSVLVIVNVLRLRKQYL